MYYDGFDASSYLEHYGVKGMKWGIRKASLKVGNAIANRNKPKKQLDKRNKNYGSTNYSRDMALYGRGGAERINKRLNKGQTLKQARRREFATQVGIGLSAAAIYYASYMAADYLSSPAARMAIKQAKSSYVNAKAQKAAAKAILKIGAGSVVNLKKSMYSVV